MSASLLNPIAYGLRSGYRGRMLSASQQTESRETSALQGHIAYSLGNTVHPLARKPRNATRKAVDVLLPWTLDKTGQSPKPLYQGYRAGLAALLMGHASTVAAMHWLSDRRATPNWFRSILLDHLRQRKAEIDDAIQALEAMPERRGTGAGLRDWWRDKKARENAAQTKLERDKARSLR